ncbi:alpha-N-arabinofuranosidase [Leifsonia sp. NPDC058194]|uniref:alpha-N-arabinofuranosidase n=1 Tax=Leifsonia sp. NPDC058194 TaxID=3346374 RepID=UPI0036DBAA41
MAPTPTAPAAAGAAETVRVPITVDLGTPVGVADPRLFGSFVEHLGRSVYGGLYDPADPSSTPEGFRADVLDLVAELGVTVVRYPGGNFVSGYDWHDGVGPREQRPRRLDLAWKSIETNEFGTDEFIAWCRAAGVEPMLAVNLGLGDLRSALHLLEYANHPSGTALSDERVGNGAADPHDVRLWCLGNELDGPWQLGFRTAEGYAEVAAQAATAMRMFDDTLELVAVGSSNADMPTFGAWEDTVLDRTVELVDYLSCHIYFYNDGDLAAFVRSAETLDAFLDDIAGRIRRAKEAHPAARDVRISLDEWNVWNYRAYDDLKPERRFEQHPRLLEEEYTLADAVVVGSLLQSILRHADVVGIAALAQLVNVIGPIRAEPGGPAWRQTTFHPFAAAARSAGHTVLATRSPEGSDVGTTVTLSPDATTVEVMLTNRSLSTAAVASLDVAALGAWRIDRVDALWDDDPLAANTEADPERVVPRAVPAGLRDGLLTVALPPLSWAAVRLDCTKGP